MRTVIPLCVGSLLVLLAGCAHDSPQVRSPFLGQWLFTNSLGERSCVLHGTPLVTTNGFSLSRSLTTGGLAPDYAYIGSWYPNHVGFGGSLRRSQYCDEPTPITYCPQCDAEFERAWELYRNQNRGRDE